MIWYALSKLEEPRWRWQKLSSSKQGSKTLRNSVLIENDVETRARRVKKPNPNLNLALSVGERQRITLTDNVGKHLFK